MSDLPELYWSPSQGLIYRSGGAVSETWSVDPRDAEPAYTLTGDEVPADAVRLVAGRAAVELPRIPDTFRFEPDKVSFVTYEETWHVFGPARRLPIGKLVWVDRFSDDTNQQVRVGVRVAERTVRHRHGRAVTYAINKIDKGE